MEEDHPDTSDPYRGWLLGDIVRAFVRRRDLGLPYVQELLVQAVMDSAEFTVEPTVRTVADLRLHHLGSRVEVAGVEHGHLLGVMYAREGTVRLVTSRTQELAARNRVPVEFAGYVMPLATPCRLLPTPPLEQTAPAAERASVS